MKIKAIIFDFFGLLYPDTSWIFFENHQEAFGDDGEFLDRLNNEIDLGRINHEQYYERLSEKTGIPVADILAEITDRELNEELVSSIRALKKSYKIGLLSNAGPHLLDILRKEKLIALFDVLTISYQHGVTKPNRQIFLNAAKELGVKPEECIFIDDRLVNTEAAEKLGMQTIYYQNVGQYKEDLKELLHA